MSDEPQPQQPNKGGAPEQPLPAAGPAQPGETAGGATGDTRPGDGDDRDRGSGKDRPGSNHGQGQGQSRGRDGSAPGSARGGQEENATSPADGTSGGQSSPDAGVDQAARARRAALAAQMGRAARAGDGSKGAAAPRKPQGGLPAQQAGQPREPGKPEGAEGQAAEPHRPGVPAQAPGKGEGPRKPGAGEAQRPGVPQQSGKSQSSGKSDGSEGQTAERSAGSPRPGVPQQSGQPQTPGKSGQPGQPSQPPTKSSDSEAPAAERPAGPQRPGVPPQAPGKGDGSRKPATGRSEGAQRPGVPQQSGKSQGPGKPEGSEQQAAERSVTPRRPGVPGQAGESQGSAKSDETRNPTAERPATTRRPGVPGQAAPPQASAKPRDPEKPEAQEPNAAESTQVLRRVNTPRASAAGQEAQAAPKGDGGKPSGGPQGSRDAQVPETTQVLRKIKTPTTSEPSRPGNGTTAAKGAPAATPGGADRGPRATTAGSAAKTAQAATGSGTAKAAQAAMASGGAARAGTAAARAATTGNTTANTTATEPPAPAPATANADSGGGAGGAGKGKKPKRPKRTGWRRLIPTWRMLLSTFVIGVMLIIGLFFLGYSLVQIPSANALATKQSNVYLYADGSQLARDTRDSKVNRENVSLTHVSKAAQHAVLAAEDRDFYSESAVDPKAMLRAGWNTALGKGKQSGSTITQQYVKNYYLGQEQTVTRKAKEFFISMKLDREKSKDDILEGYLNTSYFGRSAYGIQAAAQAYYGKDAADLDPARAAYIAALVNAPSEYDVVAHPENKPAAVARWNYVLDGMVKEGWLGKGERTGLKFPTPKEQTLPNGLSGQRGYLVDAARQYPFNDIVTSDQLEAGGYRITTTIQKNRQDAFVKAVDDQLISKLDKKNRKADNYVRAGGASVDPKTGKIVAIYGGIDYVKQYTNGATRGDFQVGSTFKPFVFTSAVQNSSTTQDSRPITPNTIYDGTSRRPVQGWTGGGYNPANEDEKSYGDIPVRKATDLSVNAVYAQMAVDVGPAKVKQTAVDLGIPEGTKDLQPYPSIALGTATASVLDMAEAYATLANHGQRATYTMVEKVTKDGTQQIELPERQTKRAVTREAADTTTSILQSVVDNGTAVAAQAAGRPAAGKTGTAEEDTAAWFAGYTPELATVVSVMGQDPVTADHKSLYYALGQPRMNGGGPPTAIWAQYTRDALKGKPVTDFDLQLQPGADQTQAPIDPSDDPSTGSQNDGGTTGTPTNGGTTGSTPTTDGGTTGSTPTTDGGTTDGGTTTDGGGTTTDGGTTDGGATTTGGTTTGGPTTSGGTDTGGGTPGGSTGGLDTGGGTDTGATGGQP
ncbi:transglycosylase domain-containing protein [Streptomyces sp. SAS_269]